MLKAIFCLVNVHALINLIGFYELFHNMDYRFTPINDGDEGKEWILTSCPIKISDFVKIVNISLKNIYFRDQMQSY